ncbi:type II toxin-antitoxin system VapC family toxin [Bdellovibrionota bacterium FG-2]
MKYLLDTNICIAWIKGDESVKQRLMALAPGDVVTCSIVKAELIYGAFKSKQRARNEHGIRGFLRQFHSLPFDDAAAEQYGVIRTMLEHAGTPIGPHDLMIAAIAQANGLTAVTRNIGEFERITTLKCEVW